MVPVAISRHLFTESLEKVKRGLSASAVRDLDWMKWIYGQVAPLRGQMDSGVDHRERVELPSLAADELSPCESRKSVPALHPGSGKDNHKIKKACASLAQTEASHPRW